MRPIIQATLVAGTSDILAAMGLTLYYGRQVPDMLRFVASGPFPAATGWGAGGAVLGLAVHFALIAVMAGAFVWAGRQWPALTGRPLLWGVIYGLITYVAMNLIVLPARFGGFPNSAEAIVPHLLFHIVLVGIPIALIVARSIRVRSGG